MDKKKLLFVCVIVLLIISLSFFSSIGKYSTVDISPSSSTVSMKEPETLELNYENVTLCVGEKIGFVPFVPENTSYESLRYESSEEDVVNIEKNILTAKSEGKAVVKAVLNNGVEAVCDVTVISAPAKLEFSRNNIVLFVNESFELNMDIDYMSEASHTFDVSKDLNTEISENGTIKLSAQKARNYVINVKTFNGLSAVCNVKVVEKKEVFELENFNTICQFPELPTGCEVTAATMALRYLGFDIGKCELADLYLPYIFNFEGDVRNYFLGHPRDDLSAGCYAPCIVTTLENYLEAKELSNEWVVENITDSSPEALYEYVSKGIPVIVWLTSSFKEPYVNYWCVGEDGELIPWMFPEHCAVLVGYDKENGTVDIADSEYGITCVRSMEDFEKIYDMMMQQAIIVYKK